MPGNDNFFRHPNLFSFMVKFWISRWIFVIVFEIFEEVFQAFSKGSYEKYVYAYTSAPIPLNYMMVDTERNGIH